MNIADRLKKPEKAFSFEFYPPKSEADAQKLYETIKDLRALKPDFISITNSSMGTAPYKTVALSGVIKDTLGLEVMAHLTCIAHSRDEIRAIAERLKLMGISNVLALRGDRHNIGAEPKRDYNYASELTADLKAMGGFSIGAAGYPEKHPEAETLEIDISNLKAKVEAGAEFVITQLFFENRFYFEFVDRVRKAGIKVPVVPGLMPLTSYNQIKSFTDMFSVSLPRVVVENVERYAADKEALMRFSVDYASKQAEALLAGGAPGIHFYTLNRSRATKEILSNIRPS